MSSRLNGLPPYSGTRLSMSSTSAPRSTSRRARLDPMKPSPPVTTTRLARNAANRSATSFPAHFSPVAPGPVKRPTGSGAAQPVKLRSRSAGKRLPCTEGFPYAWWTAVTMSAIVHREPRGRHYVAVFLLSLSVLMLEIAVARSLAVALFSHFAFVAVSLTMFGLGVSGLVVYLLPDRFTAERLDAQLVAYAGRFALSTALSMVLFLQIEVVQELSPAGFITLSFAFLTLALPFFFGGVGLSLMMTHFAPRIGSIYCADLVGASLGCLGVVLAMSVAPAPQVVAYVAAVVAAATLVAAFVTAPRRLAGPIVAVVVTVAVSVLGHTSDLLRMRYVKNWTRLYSEYESWNAFSRVTVFPSQQNAAQLLPLKDSADAYAGRQLPQSMIIDIDGTAWTPMTRFNGDMRSIEFLRGSVLYVAHQLRPQADTLIIGTGGGRDLLAAKAFGQPSVLGIEINPLMRHIVQEVYAQYSGGPYTLPGVEVVIDEARSHLSTMARQFGVIQLSLIDTFSLNAAGGFVFSENYLYTQ